MGNGCFRYGKRSFPRRGNNRFQVLGNEILQTIEHKD